MPRLLLLRHAKAERACPGEPDHERPLDKRGVAQAHAVAAAIVERGEQPDLVLCSTAVRTRQTWQRVREAMKAPPEERFLRAVYEAGRGYLAILRQEGGPAQSLLLIGHNPAIQATAVRLAADLDSPEGAALAARFPTAGLAILGFDGKWPEIRRGSMRLTAFFAPPGEAD